MSKTKLVVQALLEVRRPARFMDILRACLKRGKISGGGLHGVLERLGKEKIVKRTKLSHKNVQYDFELTNQEARRLVHGYELSRNPPPAFVEEAKRNVKILEDCLSSRLSLASNPKIVELSASLIVLRYAETLMELIFQEAAGFARNTDTDLFEELMTNTALSLRRIYRDEIRHLLDINAEATPTGWSRAVSSTKEEIQKVLAEVDELSPQSPRSKPTIVKPSASPESILLFKKAFSESLPSLRENYLTLERRALAKAVSERRPLGVESVESVLRGNPSLVNDALVNKQTALHLAAKTGDIATIRLLLKHGALRDVKDEKGRTAPQIAERLGNIKAFRLLGRGVNPRLAK
jgi:hypothetical protein